MMERLNVSWANTMPVWWSFYWRATVFGLLAGGLLGAVGGFVVAMIGRPDLAGTAGAVAGYAVGIPISMWCMKEVLGKTYKDFSVCLVRNESQQPGAF